jgi:hypothetical protein
VEQASRAIRPSPRLTVPRAAAACLVLFLAASVSGQGSEKQRVGWVTPWTRIRHLLVPGQDWVSVTPDERTMGQSGRLDHRQKAASASGAADRGPVAAPAFPIVLVLKRSLLGTRYRSVPAVPAAPRGPPASLAS